MAGGQNETELKAAILQYLSCRQDIVVIQHDSVGVFDPIKKIYRKKNNKYHLRGVADLILQYLVFGVPILVFIELKSDKGRQSDDQKNFEEYVKARNGFYFVCRSIDSLLGALYRVKDIIAARLQIRDLAAIQSKSLLS